MGRAVGTVGTVASSAGHVVKDVWEVTKEALDSGHEAIKEKSGYHHPTEVSEVWNRMAI